MWDKDAEMQIARAALTATLDSFRIAGLIANQRNGRGLEKANYFKCMRGIG